MAKTKKTISDYYLYLGEDTWKLVPVYEDLFINKKYRPLIIYTKDEKEGLKKYRSDSYPPAINELIKLERNCIIVEQNPQINGDLIKLHKQILINKKPEYYKEYQVS